MLASGLLGCGRSSGSPVERATDYTPVAANVPMGSKEHYTCFNRRVFSTPFDQAAWQKYTMANKYGPRRASNTAQYRARAAKRAGENEDEVHQHEPRSRPRRPRSGSGRADHPSTPNGHAGSAPTFG